MGGKSELAATNHVVPAPTQEQLRIAQITSDSNTLDGEKAAFQKMVRQVMEATKCNQNTAEIALFDHSNSIEEAVLAIIDRNETEIWTESKNRKAKKEEKALEDKENFVEKRERGQGFRGGRRGKSERPDRSERQERERPERQERGEFQEKTEKFEKAEKFDRSDRGNRSGRGRGSSTTTRGGRGGGAARGGSTRPLKREDRDRNPQSGGEGGFAAPMTMWDNNMQNTKDDEVNGENEELNWNTTPLVFSRREPQPQSQQQPVQTSYSSVSAAKPSEPGKPMSFAAAAAMRKKAPEPPAPGPIEPPQRSYEKECQPSPSVSPQK